jgi:hypothetical protein
MERTCCKIHKSSINVLPLIKVKEIPQNSISKMSLLHNHDIEKEGCIYIYEVIFGHEDEDGEKRSGPSSPHNSKALYHVRGCGWHSALAFFRLMKKLDF